MPGLHFISTNNRTLQNDEVLNVLKQLEHDKYYKSAINHSDNSTIIGSNYYEYYPIRKFETEKYLIFLEGHIYNKNDLKSELQQLANIIFSHKDNIEEKIRTWLMEQDGEFLILLQNKENGCWGIINDVLGRLPLYFYNDDENLILSREIRFITSVVDNLKIDKIGLAQYLYFGYGLNNRTFIHNIERLPPASFLYLSENSKLLNKKTVYRFNFEEKNNSKSIDDTVKLLEDELITACKNRATSERNNILSLSGGLDSRVVAVGLNKSGTPFNSFTFESDLPIESSDLVCAREVAEKLKLTWEKILLKPAYGKDIKFILDIKGGMNIISNALYMPFIRELENRYDKNIMFFSGDGGDKLLPNLLPLKKLKNIDQLTKYIMRREKLIPFQLISSWLGVSLEDFVDELQIRLSSYPETDFNQKYVHFMIYERAMRWLFEGEDCNRCSFWATTPFYSLNFFKTSMSVPDDEKKYHKLYKKFLHHISQEAALVNDAKRNKSVLSDSYKREQQIISAINKYPRIADTIKSYTQKQSSYDKNSLHIKLLKSCLQRDKSFYKQFDKSGVADFQDNLNSYSIAAIDNILTVLLSVESHFNTTLSIYDFLDEKL